MPFSLCSSNVPETKNTQPKETIDAELTILIVFANKWPKKKPVKSLIIKSLSSSKNNFFFYIETVSSMKIRISRFVSLQVLVLFILIKQ